jgi:hypothetical protein
MVASMFRLQGVAGRNTGRKRKTNSCAVDAAAYATSKLHLLQKYCFLIVNTSFQFAQLISEYFHVASMRPGRFFLFDMRYVTLGV